MVAEKIDIDVVVNGRDQLKDLSVTLRNLLGSMQDTVRVTGTMDARQRALSAAVGHTNRSLGQHATSLRGLAQNHVTLSQEIKRVTSELQKLKAASSTAYGANARAIQQLSNSAGSLKQIRARAVVADLRSIGTEMKRTGKDAQFVGRSLIIGLTTPLLAFGRMGLQSFYALDKQLVRLNKLLGTSAQATLDLKEATALSTTEWEKYGVKVDEATNKLDALEQTAQGISYAFGISKDLIVAVTGDFAELGINSADALANLTKLTAEFAVLGGVDISAAQSLTQTLFLGSIRAMEMTGRIRDFSTAADINAQAIKNVTAQMYMFNAIENATALSLQDMAESLPEVSAAGLAFGLNFNEMMAILAPMKAVGIDVAVAATGMKTSFQKLVNPTIKLQKELKMLSGQYADFGLTELSEDFLTVQGVGMDSIQSLINITKELDKVGGQERILNFYSKLFDDRQATRMLTTFQDLIVFQDRFTVSVDGVASAEKRLIDNINKTITSQNQSLGINLALVSTVEDLARVTTLANIALKDGQDLYEIESLGRAFSRAEIEAAKQARIGLRDYISEESKAGRNLIEDITSQSGRVLAINLAGAESAKAIADLELEKAMNSVSVAIDRIRIAIKNMATSFIKDFEPVIKNIADRIQNLAQAFEELPASTKRAIAAFIAFVGAIGPAVFIFGQFRLATGVLLENFMKLIPGIRNLTIESIAGAPKLLNLKNSLMITGDTVVNTNSRFATFVATIASGNGPIAKMAEKFGHLTGMLKRTNNAASDLTARVENIKRVSAEALSLGATGVAPTFSPFGLPIKPEDIDMENLRIAERQGGSLTKNGRFRIPGAGFVTPKTLAPQARLNLQRARALGISTTELDMLEQVFFADRGLKRGGTLGARQFRDIKTGRFASMGMSEKQARSAMNLRSRLAQAAGISFGQTQEGQAAAFLRDRQLTSRQERRLVLGGARGRFQKAVLGISGGITNLDDNIIKLTKKATGFDAITKSANKFKLSIDSGKKAIADLAKINASYGMQAPGFFARSGAGMGAFTKSIFSGAKAFKFLRVAMISTGIGAIILGLTALVFVFIKNFDKIRTQAKPGLDMLKATLQNLIAIGKALLAPFLDFFAAFAGANNGAKKANAIADVFNKISKYIKIASEAIKNFVNKFVVPLLYRFLTMIFKVINGVVQFIKGIIKLKDNWREGLKMMLSGLVKIGGAILSFFVGTMLRLIVAGNLKAVDMIISAFGLLPRGIGNGIEAAANLFADFVDGIAEAIRGTPIIGWLADKAGIVDAGRSAANMIRGVGKFAGEAGRGVADFVSGLIDPLAKSADSFFKSFGANEIGKGAGADFMDGMGQGGKEGAQDVADEYEDIMVDAGGDAGTAGGEAAGQAFMDKFLEAFNDLKQKFVDLVLDSVKGSMDKAVEDMQNALDDQRDAALEVFDTQLKAIESLEKAEESLTKEKEYQANRRKMLEERELQRANYIRNRALAIYEGRIDDARMLNLEEQKNTIDFNQNLAKTDEERRKDLVKENLETLKDSIKKAQEDTKKLLDDQIKAFQDAAAEITKFPPQTIEEYQNQINQLNSVATATASENGAILRNMMNSMRENLVMPNENLGVFATSLDQLVVVAQQKYGLTGEPGDNTIVGATIGMLAGIQGQIVDNTENITAAFDGIVTSIFDTASTIGNIGTEIITPALDAMATIFTENNPAAIFEEAFAFANESIRREWEKTVGHVSSKVDELTKHIEDSLVQILAAQTQMGIVAGGGAGGAGGVAGGTRSQGDHDGDGGTATGGQVVPGNLTDSLQRSIGPFVDSFISSNALLNNLSSSAKATLRANSVQRIKEIGAMFVTNKTPQQRGAILSFYKDAITGNLRKVVDAFLIENFGYGFYNSSINTATTQSGPRLNPSRLFNGGRVRLGYGGMKVPGFSSQGVPAILHGGEYVVSSKALSNLGIATLESINSMRYAQPGGVSAPGSTMVTENKNIYISVENFIGEDEWFNSMLKKYNMTVLPKNQKSAGMENRVITSYNGLSRGL